MKKQPAPCTKRLVIIASLMLGQHVYIAYLHKWAWESQARLQTVRHQSTQPGVVPSQELLAIELEAAGGLGTRLISTIGLLGKRIC